MFLLILGVINAVASAVTANTASDNYIIIQPWSI